MTLKSGDLVRNRYRIMHRLSDSSYRAMDISLRQSCLIKEFSGTTSERVTQLANLQHPRLPRVIDLVQEGDQTLLVMDLVEGVSLSEHLLQTSEPIPLEKTRPWLSQLLETFEYLHQQEPPIAHGDVVIDHVIVQPDGTIAFTNFSSYSHNTRHDIKGLGMIIGYLLSHTMPPVSTDEMMATLSPRTDAASQMALQMVNGQVAEINQGLHGQLLNDSSVDLQHSVLEETEGSGMLLQSSPESSPENSSEDDPTVVPNSTVPLTGRLGNGPNKDDLSKPQSSLGQPIMPWDQEDKSKEGLGTVLWEERVAQAIEKDQEQGRPLETADPPPIRPFDTNLPATEIIASSPVESNSLEADAYTGKTVLESRFDGDSDDLEENSKGFNWLWIVVAIMAGIILLCLACLGILAFNWEELTAEPTPAQINQLEASNLQDIESTLDEEPSAENEIPIVDNVAEPTAASVIQTEASTEQDGVNLPALDDGNGEIIRNEANGYQFVLPDTFTVAAEVDGSITLEAISGLDDKGIFLSVFLLTEETTAEQLMVQLIEFVNAEGGTVYGDPTPAVFGDLTGSTVIFNRPPAPDEGQTFPLLGQMVALQNSEASVMIVATAVPDQFQELTELLDAFLNSLEIFEPKTEA